MLIAIVNITADTKIVIKTTAIPFCLIPEELQALLSFALQNLGRQGGAERRLVCNFDFE